MIEKGRPWGRPATAEEARTVAGGDADLAAAVDLAGGDLVRFEPAPESDLARALGLVASAPAATEVALDVLEARSDAWSGRAVNAVVLGPCPHRLRWWHRRVRMRVEVDGRERFRGRATTVVIANGQYLHGLDVVPRGHPGDGRVELQVHAQAPRDRAGMRRRLHLGTHVPHPDIVQANGRHIAVRCEHDVALTADGRSRGHVRDVTVEVRPGTLRLLI